MIVVLDVSNIQHFLQVMIHNFYYYQQFLNTDQLMKPIAPPLLTWVGNKPFYSVEYPLELEMNMFSFPSIVFRIEYSPGQFVYQWMVHIEFVNGLTISDYLLDLSSFPEGSRLNVSYGFVTQELGLSPYSDPVEVPGNSF